MKISNIRRLTVITYQTYGVTHSAGAHRLGTPASPPYGTSLHHELALLIDGDPLQDISAVSKIAAVWCAGVPVAGVPAATEAAG